MTLRTRILLSFVPLVVLLAVVGGVGIEQLGRTGGRIDAILRENYVSVQAMFQLNEALERIDSAFQFALSAREPDAGQKARVQFDANWRAFETQFRTEEQNVTIHPTEDELVTRLRAAREVYRKEGEAFFALPPGSADRSAAYYGRPGDPAHPGLYARFAEVKRLARDILELNQANMEQARDEARETARTSLVGFGLTMAGIAALVGGIAWYLIRTTLGPIRAVTEAAREIGGSGRLDQEVPVLGRDELGRLAEAFNAMTRQLRAYRRTNLDRLVRAQRTAQATIDSFTDPVLVVDPGGRVELANPAARALLGVNPPEDGHPGMVWQPPDPLRQPVQEALWGQKPHQTESFDQAVTFQAGGEDRAYLPQVRPVRDPDGDTLGAAVVLTDVTRFRLLDQFKTDLVATVSHELKTPLTSVRLAVHLLLEETVGPLTPKQTELLIDARDNAERLLALIEQLLSLARLEQTPDRLDLRPEDPAALVRQTADAARGRAADKHVELDVRIEPDLPPVGIDPQRFARALGNLVDNAITYTPAGGHVTLAAGPAGDGRVVLSVADTGIGIPPEYLPHVFDRFFRVPGQVDAGTGLGLAIVKEVVTAHRGSVTCESRPGEGTVFRIVLPAWDRAKGGGHGD